jgi:hypothetical protein
MAREPSARDVVRAALDAAGLPADDAEVELLVAGHARMRECVEALDLPDAAAYEPADVFSARDRS